MAVSGASAEPATRARSPGAGRVPGFAKRVAECNEITPADVARNYVPLVVACESVGLMQPYFAAKLAKESEGVFALCRSDETNESHSYNDAEYAPLTASETERLLANPHLMLETKTFVTLDDGIAGNDATSR